MAPKAEVVGIGSCAVDFFAIVPRLLGPGEKINATRMETHAGGVTANMLTQVARLGTGTGWLGLIGDDENGRTIQREFAADGMDMTGVETIRGERSAMTWIAVNPEGERSVVMFPNVTGKLSILHVRNRFASHIKSARHFHTETSQLPIAPLKEAMRMAREAGVRVFMDMDVTPRFFAQMNLGRQDELCEALKLVDVLKPCKAAARELTGITDYSRMADQLLNLGPKIVAITQGEDGCLIASRERKVQVPAFRVNVVDTTGAGDAFMGGLSYSLLQGWDLERSGLFANACAALCCTRVGARAMSKLDEVNSFLKSKSVGVSVP